MAATGLARPDLQLCLMLDHYGVWTFPKGKVEAGEGLEQAALREVREEVGLAQVRVIESLGASRYRFPLGDDIFKKTVHWFLMQAAPEAEVVPVRSERVQDAGWFDAQQALAMLGYRNLRPVLRRALRKLASDS